MAAILKWIVFHIKCLFYQGNINIDNMQGTGFAWLARDEIKRKGIVLTEEEERGLKSYFNTNPSFISLVLGVFICELKKKRESAFSIRNSYAAACAGIGDSFFWHGLKPFLFLMSLFVATQFSLWGVLIYPLFYTLVHLGFIIAGKRAGELLGSMTVNIFNRFKLREWADAADKVSVFLLGVLLVCLVKQIHLEDNGTLPIASVLFVLGFLAYRASRPVLFLSVLFAIIVISIFYYGVPAL